MGAIKTIHMEGERRKRHKKVRYCMDCGRPVCTYKNPEADRTTCYQCEEKRPWTSEYILTGW